MTEIRIESLDFDSIKRMRDKDVYEHLLFVDRAFKKPAVPPKTKFNSFRVTRGPGHVSVHLCLDKKETCRVSFIPSPGFSNPR